MAFVDFESQVSDLTSVSAPDGVPPCSKDSVSEKKKERLIREVNKTKEDLCLATKILKDTHSHLNALKRILKAEVGYDVDLHIPLTTSWKDRALEQNRLKSNLIHWKHVLRGQCDQRCPDASCNLLLASASAEHLMTPGQEASLKGLCLGGTFLVGSAQDEVSRSLLDYLKLKDRYEAKLSANRILEKEILAVRKKILEFQDRYLEDRRLIDRISPFCLLGLKNSSQGMKGVEAEDYEPSLQGPETENPDEDSEAATYRKLWEDAKNEKDDLSRSLRSMEKKLELLKRKIIRSENICSENIAAFRVLSRKISDGVVLSKQGRKMLYDFGKYSVIQYRSQKSQLEAAVEENEYLRAFVKQAFLSKPDDLDHLDKSLGLTVQTYRKTLEEKRSNKPSSKSI